MRNKVDTSKTERRAADREFMAKAVMALAQRLQLSCKRQDIKEPREISLDLQAPSGLCVRVNFEARSIQPDIHVLSWHMDSESERKLSDVRFGGNVNPHHKRKATYIAAGFEDLMAKLEGGFVMANDGSAYLS